MSTGLRTRPDWKYRPAWSLFTSREEFGGGGALLSLSAAYGVRERIEGEGRAASEDLSGYRVVKPGDIVINRLVARDGAIAVSGMSGIISPAYWVLKTSSCSDPRYFGYVLNSTPYLAEIGARSKFMPPAQFDLLWDQFRTLPIPCPGQQTQRAIADYLDTETARIDALIAKKQRMINLLEERARALIQTWTRFGLGDEPRRESSTPWIVEVPASWSEVQLRRLGSLSAGVAFPDSEQGVTDGALPWFKVSDLSTEGNEEVLTIAANSVSLETAKLLRCPIVPAGTIVFPKIGAALLTNRRRTLATDSCMDQNLMGITIERGVADYFYFLLQTIDFGGIRMPGPVPLLNEQDAAGLRLPLPPPDVQLQIASRTREVLARVRPLAAALRRSVDLLAERRQVLITAAVTGELKVPGVAA